MTQDARNVIKGRWSEAESNIMQEPTDAYNYATKVIKGRWPEAESVIALHPYEAVDYAATILKGRWPEAEPYIQKDPDAWRMYQEQVLRGKYSALSKMSDQRDPQKEMEILDSQDLRQAVIYAKNVLKGRWPEAELFIMKDPAYAKWYAENVIGGDWPEAGIEVSDSDLAWANFDLVDILSRGLKETKERRQE